MYVYFRISALKEDYQEDLELSVFIISKGGEKSNPFYSEIIRKNDYNSWFYVDFGKKVFVPKGAKCMLSVRSSNVYQLIPFAHIKENIDKAVKCKEISELNVNLIERELKGDEKFTRKSFEKDGDNLFCIKSVSVIPVNKQGCLDNIE